MSDINQLYSVLFDTLKDLRDPEKKIDTLKDLRDPEKKIDTGRVKLINDTAKNIIDTAKTEVDCMRVTGTRGSGFLPAPNTQPQAPAQAISKATLVPAPPTPQGMAGQLIAANVTRHEIK